MQNTTQMIPQQMQRLIGSSICAHVKDRRVMDWQPIDTAPFGRDVYLSVIEGDKIYPLVFLCRRTESGWLHALTGKPVRINPTHWCLGEALMESRNSP